MKSLETVISCPGATTDKGGEDEHRDCGSTQPDRDTGTGGDKQPDTENQSVCTIEKKKEFWRPCGSVGTNEQCTTVACYGQYSCATMHNKPAQC